MDATKDFERSIRIHPDGADRLLFAQADGERSGELFLIDLSADPDTTWPPDCRREAPRLDH